METDIEFIQTNYLPYLESEGDITEFEQLINTHPLYGNISLSIMLNSTLLPKFASASYAEINSLAFELETDRDSINAREVDPNLRLELIEPYLQDMQYLKEFLLIEIAYVQGNISNEQAQIEYNRLKSD